MAITDAEAQALAVSLVTVAEYYPGVSGAVSGETMAWLALIQTLAMVYAPRIMAAMDRRKRETADERQAAPGFVGPFQPQPQQQEFRQ